MMCFTPFCSISTSTSADGPALDGVVDRSLTAIGTSLIEQRTFGSGKATAELDVPISSGEALLTCMMITIGISIRSLTVSRAT